MTYVRDPKSATLAEYDVIILGTGFVESILAGALARIGKSVLHLDSNEYYGGSWTSFNFQELLDWAQLLQGRVEESNGNSQETDFEGKKALPINLSKVRHQAYSTIEYVIYANLKHAEENEGSEFGEEQTDDSAKTALDYDALARFLLTSEEYEQSEAIAKVITEQFKSKILDRTRENEEAIVIESTRLAHLLHLHKDDENISEETIRHVSTSLSNFERIETLATLLKESRRYNLDLAPKIMPCRGELIELLISSGVGRYLEFKALDRTYIYSDQDKYDKVPCSKEDVFTSQTVSLVDKRKLMRFLTFALDYTKSPEKFEGYEETSYDIFLKEKFQIDGKLLSAVLYAIALVRTNVNNVNTRQGLTYTQRYLKSLGRYGNAAFLVALYGAGNEIAQGFCRISAVFGGIYMLNHSVRHLLIDKSSNNFTGLIDANGQQLSSTFLVTAIDYIPENILQEHKECDQTSRAIVIIDQYIHEEGDATLTIFPPDSVGNEYPISVLQFSAGTQTCPEDKYVLYMSTKAYGDSAKADLHNALEKLVNLSNNDASLSSCKPNPLFALFYRHNYRDITSLSSSLPNNIIVTSDPDSSLDFEAATIQAKQLFEKMCPNDEFLPAGPDPDEEDFNID
ncbi:5254_t:CDS:10 [Funneliformis mosseae]|uniref:Rab escort protein 1 n=1 Tax=Funneliformis mosseae TaxID=27381 RepID=A0A9N8VLI1_FUNMO|nr:5254_t:CDS:10 [Funneliformis mosseae]